MATGRLTLSCRVYAENASIQKEELFWKTCTWTRISDGAVCHQYAKEDSEIKKEHCDSTMGDIEIGTGSKRDRLECSITLPDTHQRNNGAWKCTLGKCNDRKDGGCISEYPSNCSKEVVVSAQVCKRDKIGSK